MEEKAKLILGAEHALARRIALGCIVVGEIKWWRQIIPGMFIFDFLQRTGETRKYSQYCMFPRKLAMAAALSRKKGLEGRLNETALRTWLAKQGLYTDIILEKQMATVEILVDHFERLLDGLGQTSPEIVASAFPRPAEYQAYLDRLTAAEADFYTEVTAKLGESSPGLARILAIQTQSRIQRDKDLEALYGAG
jgi:hypothetical protein